jgi:SOS response regulatory protein OraA/RecX
LLDLDEQALALRAAEKNSRKYRRLEWPEFRKKLLGFLARRGFNYDVSAPAVEQAWARMQDEA